MAYFNNRAEDWERLDWQILRDGGISLYWRAEYLAEDAQWLSNHDYNLYDFDCATWVSREDMFSDFGRALHFPEWWGRNFDALDDCITELELPESPGAAIVLRHFDVYAFHAEARTLPSGETEAVVLLDMLASASRFHLLNGRRLVVLVQSDDPELTLKKLGGKIPQWNHREWLNENRRPSSR
jgi:RNAse (barnase) inhibitor barstar